MHFLAEACAMLAVSLLLIFSLTSVGAAVAGKILRGFSNPLFVPLAIAFGIPVHALIGLLVAFLPVDKRISAAVLLVIVNSAALAVNIRSWPKWKPQASVAAWPLALWIGASLFYALVTFYPVRVPDVLFDGPYVIKKDTLYVRMQALTGDLPLDNLLPDVVTEYLLRGISFAEEHPIMPGQEVSNRPILMALVAVPARALLGPTEIGPKTLPKFTYLGVPWPDISILVNDTTFRQFLAVGIPLNATIIIAFWFLGRFMGVGRLLPLAAITLVALSPYIMMHTIFTWPKNMAAMFILLGMLVTAYRQPPWLAGLILGLGYWSHPLAIVFAGAMGLYHLGEYFMKRAPVRNAVHFGIVFALTIAPWLLWTRFVLHIPSDLIEQNFSHHIGFVGHVWMRLYNFTNLVFPIPFAAPGFVPVSFARTMTISLCGMIGLPFSLPALYALFYYMKQYRNIALYGALIPGLLLIGVFSVPAVPAMHGWQGIALILLVLALKFLQEKIPARVLVALILLQGVINIGIMNIYAHDRLPHCPEKMDKCTLFERLSGHA